MNAGSFVGREKMNFYLCQGKEINYSLSTFSDYFEFGKRYLPY